MEWIVALAFAIAFLGWGILFLARKLLVFFPKLKALRELSEQVEVASTRAAELEATVSAISDDPAIHEARRAALLRKKRQLKRERERRLRFRFRDL